MAKSYEEFRTSGKQMVDYICDLVKNIEKYPVVPTNVQPGFLAPLLPKAAPEFPESYKEVMNDFDKKIMPGMVHWNHPGFFAYFGNGNAYPSLLGEMVSTAMAAVGFSWSSCPALNELEIIVADWYAKALDLPATFLSRNANPMSHGCGTLQNGASDAVLACVTAARNNTIRMMKEKDKLDHNENVHDSVYLSRLVVYASSQAHSCSEKAAKVNMMKFRGIEPDSNDQMRGEALERQVAQDVELGLIPCCVVGSLGTTSQTAFDNLVEIGEVCKKYPTMWFHVDGAFGGNMFVLPETRHLKAGLEMADSIEINPNKLMMASFDCTFMYVRDTKKFIHGYVVDPLYLDHEFNDDVVDLRHFGIPLSRRFRALKMFFFFRMIGLNGMKDYIKRVIACGHRFEELVKGDDRFEVRNQVQAGLVCFRLLHDDTVNSELLARLNKAGKIHLTPARCRGKYIIRFMACQQDVNFTQIEYAWSVIKEAADEIYRELNENDGKLIQRRMSSRDFERFSYTKVLSKHEMEKLKLDSPILINTGNFT